MKIVQASTKQDTALGAMLARAFMQDPLCCYIFQNEATRERKLRYIFQCWTRLFTARGAAYAADNMTGAALWHAPEHGIRIGLLEQARAGFLRAPWAMTPAEQWRGLVTHLDAMASMKKHAHGPHWVLDTLGVAPEHQKEGVASALLRAVFEKADAASIPCFVNTHNPANIAFYQKQGFQLVEEKLLTGTSVSIYALHRPAAPVHDRSDA